MRCKAVFQIPSQAPSEAPYQVPTKHPNKHPMKPPSKHPPYLPSLFAPYLPSGHPSYPPSQFAPYPTSQHVPFDAACKAILHGDCKSAIAGGVSVFTSPFFYQNLSAASFLSPTGASKSFDASADDYCREEDVDLGVFKRLSQAVAGSDTVLGTILATSVRQSSNKVPITGRTPRCFRIQSAGPALPNCCRLGLRKDYPEDAEVSVE